jgi:hypothetical protein
MTRITDHRPPSTIPSTSGTTETHAGANAAGTRSGVTVNTDNAVVKEKPEGRDASTEPDEFVHGRSGLPEPAAPVSRARDVGGTSVMDLRLNGASAKNSLLSRVSDAFEHGLVKRVSDEEAKALGLDFRGAEHIGHGWTAIIREQDVFIKLRGGDASKWLLTDNKASTKESKLDPTTGDAPTASEKSRKSRSLEQSSVVVPGETVVANHALASALKKGFRTVERNLDGCAATRRPDNGYPDVLERRQKVWTAVKEILSHSARRESPELQKALADLKQFSNSWEDSRDEQNMPRIFGGYTRNGVHRPGLETLLREVFLHAQMGELQPKDRQSP